MSHNSITWNRWEANYHETMASTARVSLAVTRGATILVIAADLWSIRWKMSNLVELFQAIEPSKDALEKAQLNEIAIKTRELYNRLTDFFETARRKRLTNRTLTALPLQSIRALNDDLLDFVDSYELSLNDSVTAVLEEATEASLRGETVELESFRRTLKM